MSFKREGGGVRQRAFGGGEDNLSSRLVLLG